MDSHESLDNDTPPNHPAEIQRLIVHRGRTHTQNAFLAPSGVSTHLSLCKDSPDRRPVHHCDEGRIVELKKVGGLHHQYIRKAA